MKKLLSFALVACLSQFGRPLVAADPPLETGFAQPPAQTKPWCYYYWLNDNTSKEGITRDLEAMKRAGIGTALIGNIFLEMEKPGPVKVFSEQWWDTIEHAIREGDRLGVDIGLFNCPGWSQSGGPWIKSEQTMRRLISGDVRVTGPQRLKTTLPKPAETFQDVAVLAFPAPQADRDRLSDKAPRVSGPASAVGLENLVDGNPQTMATLFRGNPATAKPVTINFELKAPLTVRTVQIFAGDQAFGADCELRAQDESGEFRTVRKFVCDRSNPALGVGFMVGAPVTVAVPATTSRRFQLEFSHFFHRGPWGQLAEVNLSAAARLDSYVEKQLGKMHPTPHPMWDAYQWQTQPDPESPRLEIPADKVQVLTSQLAPDGTLTWDVPPGDWIIERVGMTPTGIQNHPAAPEALGFEVDKMNRRLAQEHFDAFVGALLKRMPANERRALKYVVADSYETGAENWTDDLAGAFRQHYGYDPIPWLPVLNGRIVGSAQQSDRFLWDLRRFVADRIATEYVGGLRAAANAHGLKLWLENYGHWGFPSEFLKYGSESDRIGGEFWVTGDLGSIECRDASSCANTYGKPFVSAESFTGGPAFESSFGDLKARGDWSFTEGVNHVVLHVYIQQPDERVPGVNAPWGTEFNRHNTWFPRMSAWTDYERRCCWLLQQGWRVADVAYFIGEDAPKMTGVRDPELPAGRDFDFINADVIENALAVKDGLLVLPHGVSYRVLVLPKLHTMRPALLRKIISLVRAGATVMGERPDASPSLQDFPRADETVRALAAELWGDNPGASGERQVGAGRIVWGESLDAVFERQHLPSDLAFREAAPDAHFLFTHRHSPEAEIYFVSNQNNRPEAADCVFRVSGRQPELWDAVTGERRKLPNWTESAGTTHVPLEFAARQSWFVVFREPAQPKAGGSNFVRAHPVATVPGPWRVTFNPKAGGPGEVEFPNLVDWTQRAEEGIKYYSGTAVYRTEFALPDAAVGQQSLQLDLGVVHGTATVRINGVEVGTRWTAPWTIDITAAAHSGPNTLEVEVVNPWHNRLVRDAQLPVDRRLTSLTLQTVKPNAPLIPAGLLGPVTVQAR